MVKKMVGKKCPKFEGECTSGLTLSNKSFVGRNLVIYFYPKDSTPGCTTEGQEFRDNYKLFKKFNTEIIGVSRDSIKSHENFKLKQSFPFELLSDHGVPASDINEIISPDLRRSMILPKFFDSLNL